MFRSFLYTSFLLSGGLAVSPVADCNYEILFLIDVSKNMSLIQHDVAEQIQIALAELEKKANSTRSRLSTFSDKPLPAVGCGKFGGCSTAHKKYDGCYNNIQGWSYEGSGSFADALLQSMWGYGLDAPQNHFEAIINGCLDYTAPWTNDATRKMIYLFTVTEPHVSNEPGLNVADKVEAFNAPISCQDNVTVGGFGAQTYPETSDWGVGYWEAVTAYPPYAELLWKRVCGNGTTTEEDELIDQYETDYFVKISADPILPFNEAAILADDVQACDHNEYPDYSGVIRDVNDKGIELFVIVLDPIGQKMQVPDLFANPAVSVWDAMMKDSEKLGNIFMEVGRVDYGATPSLGIILDGWFPMKIDPEECGDDWPSRDRLSN